MAIRAISRMLVDGVNPLNWRDPQSQPFADIGDFEIALGDTLAKLTEFNTAGQASKIKKVITLADMAKRYAKGELKQRVA